MIPVRATHRFQLHRDFTLDAAAQQVPYLRALGISHVYASPLLTARAGSPHGYDVVDPTRINPELGGEPALRRLVAQLRAHQMGLIADIVPNHMAVGGDDNAWWLDVLARGRRSTYAAFFDIDWDVPDPALRGKVLAPYLGRPYGEALAAGEIKLERDAATGRWQARYFGHAFPLRPGDEPAGTDPGAVHRLLERQHYRLAWWQSARDEINWRRFFDITDLAGLRVEEPRVFEAVHATIFRLHDEGLLDGVRVDHVDGLADPRAYCRRLRQRLGPRAYIVVEKILAPRERMPADWRVDGTTGYSFMNDVGALLHEPAGADALNGLWTEWTGRSADFEAEQRRARGRIMDELLTAELNAAALALHRVARADLATRDVSLAAIRRVLTQILVHFPVYRLYTDLRGRSADEQELMARVCDAARADCRPAERYLVDLIDRWLGREAPREVKDAGARRLRLRAITRFQQLSSPLAAKAVEDTAFYRHAALLSRNEVGANPAEFAIDAAAFHTECLRRREHFPRAMLTTATHDHKRGEDARARLAVLSERPDAWAQAAADWRALNEPLRSAAGPAPADEYMLYQTLVAHWPLELRDDDAEGLAAFATRAAAWQVKAVREAKLRSGWLQPDTAYEDACGAFTRAVLAPTHGFASRARRFVEDLASAGAANGLTQTLLRLTSPGVPDLYQGADRWDFSMVDPDNRRPVDYAARAASLAQEATFTDLLRQWRDGRVKQRLIATALRLRTRHPDLFTIGEHLPLAVAGSRADRLVAFARVHRDAAVLVVACRGVAGLVERDEPRIAARHWENTRVTLPPRLARRAWRDALEARPGLSGTPLTAAALLHDRTCALLASEGDGHE